MPPPISMPTTPPLPLSAPQFLSRNAAVEVVLSIKALYAETRAFLEGKAVSEGPGTPPSPPAGGSGAGDGPCPPQLDSPQEEEALQGPLSALGQELQRLLDVHWLVPIAHPAEEVGKKGLGGGRG